MTNTIASERKRLGLSQAQLGEMMGRDRATISRWETDPMSVSGSILCKLARIFNCSIDYLLGLTEERTPKVVA